jgi:hypothetical protein
MILNRRAALIGATALCVAMPLSFALASGATPTLTPATVITDATNADVSLLNMLNNPVVASVLPAATLTALKADLTTGQQVGQSLTTNLPAATAATTIQQINGYINAVLNTIAGPPVNGLIPAPFNMVVAAVAIIMPELEGFVDTYILNASASVAMATTRAKLAATAPGLTLAQARVLLSAQAKGQ